MQGEPEDDEAQEQESTEEAMVNACKTALGTVQEAWQGLRPHCSRFCAEALLS